MTPGATASTEGGGGETCWDTHFLDVGHTDVFYFNHDNGEPFLGLKDDTVSPYEIRDPFEVELHALESSWSQMPDSGVPDGIAGQEIYHLPLVQEPGLLWPGWESQPLASMVDGHTGGDITVDINITDVEGPGEVYMWSNDSFGELRSVFTDGGYQFPATIHQDYLAHVHAHWGFTEPGAYYLTVDGVITVTTTGETHQVGPATYLFSAGDEILNDDSRLQCDGGGGGIPDDVEPDDDNGGNNNDDQNGTGDQNGNGEPKNNGGDQAPGGGGGQAPGGGGKEGGDLAETGPSTGLLIGLGASLLLLGGGAGVVMMARRGSANSSATSPHASA